MVVSELHATAEAEVGTTMARHEVASAGTLNGMLTSWASLTRQRLDRLRCVCLTCADKLRIISTAAEMCDVVGIRTVGSGAPHGVLIRSQIVEHVANSLTQSGVIHRLPAHCTLAH